MWAQQLGYFNYKSVQVMEAEAGLDLGKTELLKNNFINGKQC